MADISLITELDRLHHRATDMRARERQLADAGENDPASDAWKTAAILAASAESEFEIALVEAWPSLAALLREAGDGWRPIESAPRAICASRSISLPAPTGALSPLLPPQAARMGNDFAFPFVPPVDDTGRQAVGYPYPELGLTKREYFAAQALTGILAQSPCGASAEQFAQEAVWVADALIKALEAPNAED